MRRLKLLAFFLTPRRSDGAPKISAKLLHSDCGLCQ